MNRPADETGGDYYDWQLLPDGRLAVAIADVTGHGIGPALMMAVCRAYSRASAPEISSPQKLLKRINTLIVDDLQGGRFITMAIGILASDGRIQFASAGHGPTVLLRAKDQSVRVFGGDGLPLGVTGEETYDEVHEFTMEPGDVLVLLTDGFVEWSRPSDNELFGTERLTSVVRDHARGSAKVVMEALDRAVRDFSQGSRQADDMTAVIIKRV
jgi:serine phosphatase RsbU (regulator of sigma subunit)